MRVTNRLGLPEAFVRAVENDSYTNHGTLSVTTLIRPPQMVRLSQRHGDEIVEDAADRVWTILGQAGHSVLERTYQDGDIVERRLFMEVDGVKISGQLDRLTKDGVLVDWKFTSVYSVMDCKKNGVKSDWEQQLNMLAALVREENKKYTQPFSVERDHIKYWNHAELCFPSPKALRIVAVCRDWRQSEADRNSDYPEKVEVLKVPLWDHDKAMAFIRERIRLHTMDNPPPCTDAERWATPEKWAVMEKSKKRALRLLDSKELAEQWCIDNGKEIGKQFYLEYRQPSYTRCERFCPVSKFCPQYNAKTEAA